MLQFHSERISLILTLKKLSNGYRRLFPRG